MIQITEQFYTPINIGILAVMGLLAFLGYRKGFLLQLISFSGTVVSGWGSYVLSPLLAKYIQLFPRSMNPMEDTVLSEAAYRYVNQAAWFFLVFLMFRIVFFLLGMFAKSLQKVPVIKEVSKCIGGAVGVVEAFVWLFLLTIALNTPVFDGGHEAIDQTGLKYVRDSANFVLNEYVSDYIDSDAFGQLFEDAKGLSEAQRMQIENWMIAHGYLQEGE